MKLPVAQSFFRPPYNERDAVEDGFFINPANRLYGVVDGVSEAYSPSHPYVKYYGHYSGGQIVARSFCLAGFSAGPCTIEEFTLEANNRVLGSHLEHGKDPNRGDDVGGASFAACKLGDAEEITILLAGDCYALVAGDQECSLYTGFDAAGHEIEQKDQDAFTACLAQAGGDKGKAWDLYWPHYKQKRIFCANKNIGQGGYPTLDGGNGLNNCWTKIKLKWISSLKFILLLTDGLIPPSEAGPGEEKTLAQKLAELYQGGGICAIVEWRDRVEAEKNTLTHVSGWPEGTAVMLNF